jgi:hypothetical protein
MMINVIMKNLDNLRSKDNHNDLQVKQLKDKLKIIEGATTTGFNGFSSERAARLAE